MTEEAKTEEAQLVQFETLTAIDVYSDAKVVDQVLAVIEEESLKAPTAVGTEAERKAIASFAYKFATVKTKLDNAGKEVAAEAKAVVKRVDGERKRIRDLCDAKRDKVREPLTAWELAEEQRIRMVRELIAELKDLGSVFGPDGAPYNSAAVKDAIVGLENTEITEEDFGEFVKEAEAARSMALAALGAALPKRLQEEQDAKDLIELRAKQAKDAEAKAKAEAETNRLAKLQQIKDEAAAKEKADQEAKLKAEEDARVAAEKAAEQAALAERKRIEDEQAKEKAAAEKREANKKIRSRVIGEIGQAIFELMEMDSSIQAEGNADTIAKAIADGHIPHVQVQW